MSTNSIAKAAVSEADLMAALSDWKRSIWHQMSQAADAKHAFDEDDYDDTGILDMQLPKFQELHTWLSMRRSETQFKGLTPAWRCVADNRWELNFYTVEGTIDERLRAAPNANGEVTMMVRMKTTGIIVEGLRPGHDPEEDWVLIRSDNVSSHSELQQQESGRSCDLM